MRRGDLVTVAMPGDYGKPRPALVIQADQFSATASLTVALITTSLVDAPLIRLTLDPTPENGLRKISQVMIDKVMTVRREKLGLPFGRLDNNTMLTINRGLALFLGFA
ncbi:MAG: type II toxin-antitoxin system PemK/MazF family toxin [Chromatiaceae bacterium]|nr:type II toxin-antitoxin system PemK/MazF family toxin [Chromatiaceae bacterium]